MQDKESEDVTTMRTCYENYKCKVIPFKFINTPTTFQHMMNNILRLLLNQEVVVYRSDILIYTKTIEEDWLLVTKVFSIL
jgi:hypothetical protein